MSVCLTRAQKIWIAPRGPTPKAMDCLSSTKPSIPSRGTTQPLNQVSVTQLIDPMSKDYLMLNNNKNLEVTLKQEQATCNDVNVLKSSSMLKAH